jgi:chemotaxis receptor (MCP) glutamine deamidase CheD
MSSSCIVQKHYLGGWVKGMEFKIEGGVQYIDIPLVEIGKRNEREKK